MDICNSQPDSFDTCQTHIHVWSVNCSHSRVARTPVAPKVSFCPSPTCTLQMLALQSLLSLEPGREPSCSLGFLPSALPLPILGFPGGSAGKESACNTGGLGSIPELGGSPGEGKGCPLHYFGLENPTHCIVVGFQRVGHDRATLAETATAFLSTSSPVPSRRPVDSVA